MLNMSRSNQLSRLGEKGGRTGAFVNAPDLAVGVLAPAKYPFGLDFGQIWDFQTSRIPHRTKKKKVPGKAPGTMLGMFQ
jgi:hypothetical protein